MDVESRSPYKYQDKKTNRSMKKTRSTEVIGRIRQEQEQTSVTAEPLLFQEQAQVDATPSDQNTSPPTEASQEVTAPVDGEAEQQQQNLATDGGVEGEHVDVPQIVFPDEEMEPLLSQVASINSIPLQAAEDNVSIESSNEGGNFTTLAAIDDLKSIQHLNGGGSGGGGAVVQPRPVTTKPVENDCYELSDGATLSILFCPTTTGGGDEDIIDIDGLFYAWSNGTITNLSPTDDACGVALEADGLNLRKAKMTVPIHGVPLADSPGTLEPNKVLEYAFLLPYQDGGNVISISDSLEACLEATSRPSREPTPYRPPRPTAPRAARPTPIPITPPPTHDAYDERVKKEVAATQEKADAAAAEQAATTSSASSPAPSLLYGSNRKTMMMTASLIILGIIMAVGM